MKQVATEICRRRARPRGNRLGGTPSACMSDDRIVSRRRGHCCLIGTRTTPSRTRVLTERSLLIFGDRNETSVCTWVAVSVSSRQTLSGITVQSFSKQRDLRSRRRGSVAP